MTGYLDCWDLNESKVIENSCCISCHYIVGILEEEECDK